MSIKTWLFGEANTVATKVKVDLQEEWQKARAAVKLPQLGAIVGADVEKLKGEAGNAYNVLKGTANALENELLRLKGEWERTLFALQGYEKLLGHFAGKVADDIDLGDLTQQPETQADPAPIVMTHTDITTQPPPPKMVGGEPATGADPVLDAGEQAAAQAARDALAKLPKRRVFGQS